MKQPVQYSGAIAVSDEEPLQDGSRFTFGPIPTVISFEDANLVSGERFIIYIVDTPIGRQRFGFAIEAVREHHRMLGELLDKPNLYVARDVPPPTRI